jgi:hypothetical protein
MSRSDSFGKSRHYVKLVSHHILAKGYLAFGLEFLPLNRNLTPELTGEQSTSRIKDLLIASPVE